MLTYLITLLCLYLTMSAFAYWNPSLGHCTVPAPELSGDGIRGNPAHLVCRAQLGRLGLVRFWMEDLCLGRYQ
ncbi:hypothetical protein V8C35DRAFT_293564 [Trichoderma chlorosporum]